MKAEYICEVCGKKYPNPDEALKCEENDIIFKLVFCDYHSEGYRDDNPHESARFARYLKDLGYSDQEYVREEDVLQYDAGI